MKCREYSPGGFKSVYLEKDRKKSCECQPGGLFILSLWLNSCLLIFLVILGPQIEEKSGVRTSAFNDPMGNDGRERLPTVQNLIKLRFHF